MTMAKRKGKKDQDRMPGLLRFSSSMRATIAAGKIAFRVPVHAALKHDLEDWIYLRAIRERIEGNPVKAGELRGYARALERVMCFYYSLADVDRERIQVEGEAIASPLDGLKIPKGGVPPIKRRTESILLPEAGPGPRTGHGLGGTRPPKRRRKPDGPQDAAPRARADHGPIGVE
jgi:hypothetical protein